MFPSIHQFSKSRTSGNLTSNISYEEIETLKLIKKIINLGDWVSILHSDFFQGFIINIESPCPILLMKQHNCYPIR